MTLLMPNDAKSEPELSQTGLPTEQRKPLIDPFGRRVSYVRLSVTDRCDMRCTYCMAEEMQFLPRAELLTLEELNRLCTALIERGVEILRITGGEPLIRQNIMSLFKALSRHLSTGALRELTLTTNGSQLARFASPLADCGVRRINVSLDSLNADKYHAITRFGHHAEVLAGIEAARKAGLKIKINMVALRGVNDDEIVPMLEWAHGYGMDLTLIEVMPMGTIGADRADQYLPLTQVRSDLESRYTLKTSSHKTGGPARYAEVQETGGRIGFITPLTHNFCEGCNRVRVTCKGTLFMCLGQEDAADLRAPLRASTSDDLLHQTLDEAILRKPKGHDFDIGRHHAHPAVPRHMSMTGG
ncbi:GTP 3',8-cyclase MoaA [Beijerinckia mobilis]|uniref:GTP 3',8-cyclase MoaA n=1 Tax=Beijerinckia mobilis TaxID=231434 RepID=UPI000A075CB5|nr:GTP 3',8-cyclase MoaA [Beijerinckia mobilis]